MALGGGKRRRFWNYKVAIAEGQQFPPAFRYHEDSESANSVLNSWIKVWFSMVHSSEWRLPMVISIAAGSEQTETQSWWEYWCSKWRPLNEEATWSQFLFPGGSCDSLMLAARYRLPRREAVDERKISQRVHPFARTVQFSV